MTKKIDITHRQQALLKELNEDTFQREEFKAKHHIRDRTLRRDLNDLAERGEIEANQLTILRKKCLGKLTKKVHHDELSDKLMVAIVLSGETKKIETKTEITQGKEPFVVKMWQPSDEPTS